MEKNGTFNVDKKNTHTHSQPDSGLSHSPEQVRSTCLSLAPTSLSSSHLISLHSLSRAHTLVCVLHTLLLSLCVAAGCRFVLFFPTSPFYISSWVCEYVCVRMFVHAHVFVYLFISFRFISFFFLVIICVLKTDRSQAKATDQQQQQQQQTC